MSSESPCRARCPTRLHPPRGARFIHAAPLPLQDVGRIGQTCVPSPAAKLPVIGPRKLPERLRTMPIMPNPTREHRNTLWWHTAAQKPPFTDLTNKRHVSVAIIGGGFTGITAAMHLAARGTEVAVLEADEIGSGASGLNAGFVVPNFAKADPAYVLSKLGNDRGRRLLDLVGQGADRVFSTIRENGIDCDPEQVGWMHVAHSDAMLKVLQQRVDAWNDLGRPLRLLTAVEARKLTGVRRCAGALLDPTGGMLQPLNYVYGLAKAALKAGATIHENTLCDSRRAVQKRLGPDLRPAYHHC